MGTIQELNMDGGSIVQAIHGFVHGGTSLYYFDLLLLLANGKCVGNLLQWPQMGMALTVNQCVAMRISIHTFLFMLQKTACFWTCPSEITVIIFIIMNKCKDADYFLMFYLFVCCSLKDSQLC